MMNDVCSIYVFIFFVPHHSTLESMNVFAPHLVFKKKKNFYVSLKLNEKAHECLYENPMPPTIPSHTHSLKRCAMKTVSFELCTHYALIHRKKRLSFSS